MKQRALYSVLLIVILLLTACESKADSSSQPHKLASTPLPTVLPTQASQANSPKEPLIAWPVFGGGETRSGVNDVETVITANNVNRLTLLWRQHLPDVADSSPVELSNVQTAGGTKNMLFLTTLHGTLLALDATNGKIIWQQQTQGPKITNSSPVIDPSGQYVYSYGLDGKVHKYAVTTGQEDTTGGWPATITLMNEVEKESSAMNIGNGYLYVTTSGYIGDGGHYEGHVVAVNLATGKTTVFNSLCANIHQLLINNASAANYCNSIQSGIWARGGAVIDPITRNVLVATGNGPYNANKGGHDYGDSVIELSPDLTQLIDTYTPANYQNLDDTDRDLGSTAPAILPVQHTSKTPYLAVQGGKDNTLRLLNLQNLSGQGGPNHVGGELQAINLPNGCDVDTQIGVWDDSSDTTWVFVANNCGFSAFKVITNTSGQTTLQLAYHNGNAGSSPCIANGVLFLQSSGVLQAMDPTTGTVLWSSTQASAHGTIGGLHWQSPIVVNGMVFAPDEDGNVTAYHLS